MILFVKNLLFTLVLPGTLAVYIPLWMGQAGAGGPGPGAVPRRIAAGLVLLAGAAIYFQCLGAFGAFGRGTPAPIDPPKRLVVRGPYRYVRNPMYLGVLTVILGWALFFGSWPLAGYGAAVGVAFHAFVVGVEEPMLRRRFGEPYARYGREVDRWLPRLPEKP